MFRKLFASGNLVVLALLAGVPVLTGCATNTMTGRSQLMLVSEKSAIARSASAYQSMIGALETDGKISTDEAINNRVRGITDRLIDQAIRYRPDTQDWEWTIKVIDNPDTVNAFCMPGGRMAIYTGLIEKLEASDDEVAQVMGHEIAHALASHGAEKMSVQVASSIAVIAVTAAANRNNRNQQAVHNSAELAALAFINLPNSRTAEEEADKLGIELAARAGYDPKAAVTLWEKMMKESGSNSKLDFFSTHPAPPKRIEALAKLEAPMMKLYDPGAKSRPASFSWTNHPAGERPVPEFQAKGASSLSTAPEPLVFYSEAFDSFSTGAAELKCSGCVAEFAIKQGTLREHHAKESWRQLALDTIKIGYGLDLAWYYLGIAAERLGFADASEKYYAEAVRLSASDDLACSKGFVVGCGGVDVPLLARRTTAIAKPEQAGGQ